MIRGLLSVLFVAMVALMGALYALYGEVEPCKALAAERWQIAEANPTLLQQLTQQVGFENEMTFREQASRLSTGQCVSDLVASWQTRWTGGAAQQPAAPQ